MPKKAYKKRAVKKRVRKFRSKRRKTGSSMHNHSTLVYKGAHHSPLPQVYFTKFVASGFFFSGSGAGTGDYNWTFNLNGIGAPFSSVTSGVTWNNLAPASYQCAGAPSLINATMYSQHVTYGMLFEFDVTPQSVADSVVVTLTPSLTGNVPATVAAAMARPWTKAMNFASGRVYKLGEYSFRQYIDVAKYLGLPRMLYMNDVSGNFVGGQSAGVITNPPVTIPLTMNVETGDNAVLTNPLEFRVRITYYTKVYGLNNDVLLTT